MKHNVGYEFIANSSNTNIELIITFALYGNPKQEKKNRESIES
jgi:hypothetical protein